MDKVNLDLKRARLLQSIDATLQRVYRSQKNKSHTYFQNVGGLTDIPRALANPPDGMSRENWAHTVEHFQTLEFLKRSASNKGVCAQQQVVNRGGSCSYSNACFKEVSYDMFNCLFKL